MCSQVLSGRKIGPFLLTNDSCKHWSFSAPHWFAEHTSQMWWFCWDSGSYSGSDWQQTTQQWPWPFFFFLFFWCQFSLGKCFGASSLSNQWASHCWLLYKVNFSSHVTIQSRNSSLLLHRIRKNNTSKQWCFWFWGQLMSGEGNGTPLQYSCLENTMGRGAW